MIKLLLFCISMYLIFKGAKFFLGLNASGKKKIFKGPASEIEDVMIKDPYCNIYFPKREGVHLRHDGKDIYFCSEECKQNCQIAQKREDNNK